MTTDIINERYSGLAESSCCLSCGVAIDFCEPKPGEVCVDLGSGRGTDVLRMAEAVGPTGHAYGIDIADGMIEKAKKTADKMGITNASFLRCELEHIELASDSVNWVISNCVLNHAKDKKVAWKEIARILKKGGQFVISDIYADQPIDEKYRNDPEAVSECWGGAVTKEEYLGAIQAAGLTKLRILEESAPYDKGQAKLRSFTVAGVKPTKCCCCG